MNLFAHLTDKSGIREEQSLRAHCVQTAEYASECAKNIGFYHMAYLAGLLHDMGKATRKYNDYLEAAFAGEQVVRGSVNHTFAGVIYVLEHFHTESTPPMDKLAAEIISCAVGSHHGLFDCVDLEGENGFSHRLQKDKADLCYEEAQRNFLQQVADEQEIADLFQKAAKEFQLWYQKLLNDWERKSQKVFFQIGLLTRLLLSCVIYGDRRDTAEFMEGITFLQEKTVSWPREKEYLEHKLLQFDKTSSINQIRATISDQCLEGAERPNGIYRLNVPTGGGKTLCTLRYALAHAERFHKKRIIFIIPLLSVLEQNAEVIREYVQDENLILEHHSNVVSEKESKGDNAELDEYEVLTENWESPIIISTLVQLLNILFAHKTSAIGRMRALCDSVIVIDEVQSIPKKTVAMFNMAIDFLSAYCNATIVLSSATQPCLEKLNWPLKLASQPDLVKLDQKQMEVFERADITDRTDPYGMDLENWVDFCCSLMKERESLLVICNTKREARELFEQMEEIAEEKDWYICHLSTAMCQSHRVEVLEELQNQLAVLQDHVNKNRQTRKVICISTQLVEAGVDFSFDCVVRVMAGIDNLAQAAGRCNRSSEYGHKGAVYLINLKDENLSMLQDIADAQHSTQKVLMKAQQTAEPMPLTGERATQIFYDSLYQKKEMQMQIRYPIDDCGNTLYLADLLGNQNPYVRADETFFLHQPFKEIGKRFGVFDDQTFDVLVPYGDGAGLIETLREKERSSFFLPSIKNIVKQAKGYTISIYQWQRDKLWEGGLLYGLFENRILVLDQKAYDKKYGLSENAALEAGNYIV